MTKQCQHCNGEFQPKDVGQLYCKRGCKDKANRKRAKAKNIQTSECPKPYKKIFPTELDAYEKSQYLTNRYRRPYNYYPCKCGFWHLTKKRSFLNYRANRAHYKRLARIERTLEQIDSYESMSIVLSRRMHDLHLTKGTSSG